MSVVNFRSPARGAEPDGLKLGPDKIVIAWECGQSIKEAAIRQTRTKHLRTIRLANTISTNSVVNDYIFVNILG